MTTPESPAPDPADDLPVMLTVLNISTDTDKDIGSTIYRAERPSKHAGIVVGVTAVRHGSTLEIAAEGPIRQPEATRPAAAEPDVVGATSKIEANVTGIQSAEDAEQVARRIAALVFDISDIAGR